MPARRNRNGRFSKRSQTRRPSKYKKAINIKDAALGYLGASVITTGLFNQNPVEFVMGSTSAGLEVVAPSQGLPISPSESCLNSTDTVVQVQREH